MSKPRPGACSRCGFHPPAAGRRICESCRQYGRDNRAAANERNRDYYARNAERIREDRRRKDEAERTARALAGRPTMYQRRQERERLAHELAAKDGRLPTAHELHRYFARHGQAITIVGCRALHRATFGLRPIERWDPAATESTATDGP